MLNIFINNHVIQVGAFSSSSSWYVIIPRNIKKDMQLFM